MQVRKSIVMCDKYNGRKNALFLMKHDDFRFTDKKWGYTDLGEVVSTGPRKRADNGFAVKLMTTVKGEQFEVFEADWSARKV